MIYSFHQNANIIGKSIDKLEHYSLLPIKNDFNQLTFGGYNRGFYGTTPAEILRAVLIGLCKYISEDMELTFTSFAMDLISHVVVSIHQDSCGKSE